MLKFLCFVLLVAVANAIVCTPDICESVHCAVVDTASCEGVVTENGGFCGCCEACVPELAEGDRCVSSFVLGFTSFTSLQGRCAGGLYCNGQTCQKLELKRDATPCATKLAEVNARLSNDTNHMLLGLERPRCEDDGTYKPMQYGESHGGFILALLAVEVAEAPSRPEAATYSWCNPHQCLMLRESIRAICVTADGTRMYEYMVYRWEAGDDMNCQCARDQYAYRQTGMRGKIYNCEKNGNYAPVGCNGSVCYCQDKMGHQVGTTTVGIWEKNSINC